MDQYSTQGFRLKMKKNISKSKVQRMRNLATGNYTSKVSVQSGYTKSSTGRKTEGDVWEERGKQWTIKDGIKQTITKLDTAREFARIPMECPKCKARMNKEQHKFMYIRFKHCLFCQNEKEFQMRKDGTFEAWKNDQVAKNWEKWILDSKEEFKEFLKTRHSKKQITEAGDIEDWSGGQSDEEMIEQFEKFIENEKEKFNKVTK